jgi:hypothetical protein
LLAEGDQLPVPTWPGRDPQTTVRSRIANDAYS